MWRAISSGAVLAAVTVLPMHAQTPIPVRVDPKATVQVNKLPSDAPYLKSMLVFRGGGKSAPVSKIEEVAPPTAIAPETRLQAVREALKGAGSASPSSVTPTTTLTAGQLAQNNMSLLMEQPAWVNAGGARFTTNAQSALSLQMNAPSAGRWYLAEFQVMVTDATPSDCSINGNGTTQTTHLASRVRTTIPIVIETSSADPFALRVTCAGSPWFFYMVQIYTIR